MSFFFGGGVFFFFFETFQKRSHFSTFFAFFPVRLLSKKKKRKHRIVPYINASIVLQLLATAFPSLKKLQREEGPEGQARFQLYQRGLALVFAVAQAAGQLGYVRPYVEDWSGEWAVASGLSLVAGAMILVQIADVISELKIGNG